MGDYVLDIALFAGEEVVDVYRFIAAIEPAGQSAASHCTQGRNHREHSCNAADIEAKVGPRGRAVQAGHELQQLGQASQHGEASEQMAESGARPGDDGKQGYRGKGREVQVGIVVLDRPARRARKGHDPSEANNDHDHHPTPELDGLGIGHISWGLCWRVGARRAM